MKKVNNVDFAKYLLKVYAKREKNLIIRDGDVYLVDVGGKQAITKKVCSLYSMHA